MSKVLQTFIQPGNMILSLYSFRDIFALNFDLSTLGHSIKNPFHGHRARKGRIFGLKIDELHDKLIRHKVLKTPLDNIGMC